MRGEGVRGEGWGEGRGARGDGRGARGEGRGARGEGRGARVRKEEVPPRLAFSTSILATSAKSSFTPVPSLALVR